MILYGSDDAALTQYVTLFVAGALQDGDAAVVIASSTHERSFRAALEALAIDPEATHIKERLHFFDANEFLRKLCIRGRISDARFERVVGSLIRSLAKRFRVHAYGEMVGILHTAHKMHVALELERL
ncbi:MAG: MEDS domain-containing protein, partial [Candidatus Eremiobacteraeota bacterium]|nr:MEDS domain-containing protein [Candidatus Eremiobacteraeota bacterium]